VKVRITQNEGPPLYSMEEVDDDRTIPYWWNVTDVPEEFFHKYVELVAQYNNVQAELRRLMRYASAVPGVRDSQS